MSGTDCLACHSGDLVGARSDHTCRAETASSAPTPPAPAEDIRWCLRFEMRGGGVGFVACTKRPTHTDLDRLRRLVILAMETTAS